MPDYLIRVSAVKGSEATERIIRAKNEAAALKHVVADTITVDRATTDDAMRVTLAGGTIEMAGE